MKIIFLDIDGVLNNENYFDSKEDEKRKLIDYYKEHEDEYDFEDEINFHLQRRLLDIDFTKVDMIKDICDESGAKIVIVSTWKIYEFWFVIKKYLIEYGLPIIGETNDYKWYRGGEIREYLKNHLEVEKYIIIDDEFFRDYKGFEDNLIQTDFYGDGFTEEHKILALKKLK